MKRLILVLVGVAVLLSLPLAGFAQESQPPVVVAQGAQPDNLFPDFARTLISTYVNSAIYNGLVKTDASGQIMPDLAESWELSDDQLTWTFKLRHDVKWHDGEPFTAADVKFTFEYPADPTYTGTSFNNTIKGAQEKKDGKATEVSGVQVIDDYTVSITTVEPNALFLETTAQNEIMPEHVLRDVPIADYSTSVQATKPIGTGPYRLTEWLQDESMTFEAFDDYFGGAPNIKTYIWRIIPQPATQVADMLTGAVTLIPQVSPDDAPSLESEQGITVVRLIGTVGNYLMLNHSKPFFKDLRVRQALAHSIDKQGLLAATAGGFGTDNKSQLYPGIPEYNPDLMGYAYDPEQSKALLAEAGWSDENGDGIVEAHGVDGVEDGTPFSITLTVTTTPAWVLRAQVVQQFFKAIGIDTNLNAVDFNIFFSEYFTPTSDYDVLVSGWGNLAIPTLSDLTANFESTQANTEVIHWSNSEVDDLLAKIPTMFDVQARIQAYWRVQEIIEQELPVIYLERPDVIAAYSSNLVIPEVKSGTELFDSVPQWQWAG